VILQQFYSKIASSGLQPPEIAQYPTRLFLKENIEVFQ
jgi:hypothetical protein